MEWKDQCEKKWSKSLDHQSYSFKQREKRVTNSKYFLGEMKQRVQKVPRSERTQNFTSLTAKEHSMMDALNPINPELPTSFNPEHINEESLLPIYIYNFENQEILEQAVRLVYLS